MIELGQLLRVLTSENTLSKPARQKTPPSLARILPSPYLNLLFELVYHLVQNRIDDRPPAMTTILAQARSARWSRFVQMRQLHQRRRFADVTEGVRYSHSTSFLKCQRTDRRG